MNINQQNIATLEDKLEDLVTLEDSITDLVQTLEAIKRVSVTQPDLVPALLTTVQQALTGLAGELHSMSSD